MSTAIQSKLSNIKYWGDFLGLLPVNLTEEVSNRYILLNGGAGDFCLQLGDELNSPDYYNSAAWSSNTKNFVIYEGSTLKIFNWKTQKSENIETQLVEKRFFIFYEYILQNSQKSELDIVPFLVNIFKEIRNLTDEKNNAVEALNLLFVLLSSLKEPDVNNIDFPSWGIKETQIPPSFEKYIEQFTQGVFGLKPQLDLILRHASGVLFQEAHKEAIYFNKQIQLFSQTLSGQYEVRRLMYSSIHYTPSYIARTIVENSLKGLDITKETLKIFDPACGSSEFLIEILKQLKTRGYLGQITIVGWDSAETAINTSKFLLTYERRQWGDRLNFGIKKVEDSLKEVWDNDYDVILMNPPFVSWELMNKEERSSVTDALGTLSSGKPNQASAFFDKATQALKENGIIGCVVPSSLFSLSAYSGLRNVLGETLSFSLLGKLGNFVFENALTDISILVAKKSNTPEFPTIVWAKNEKGAASDVLRELRKFKTSSLPAINEKNYSVYKSENFPINSENWKIIPYQENELIKRLEILIAQKALARIQDIFDVKQGIRTGNNDVFKMSKNIFTSFPLNEQKYFRPTIDNDAIKNGIIAIQNYVWYPYSEQGMIFTTEEELKEAIPMFYERVLKHKKTMLEKRAGISEWWGLTRPRNWQFSNSPRLCSTEFGKADSFAFDLKGEFVIERGNAWIPKKKFRHTDSNYFYLSIFTSQFFNTLLSIYSKQLLSGWDLGKMYTKNIPIPSVFSSSIDNKYYSDLIEIGKYISKGLSFHPGLLNEKVMALYSLSQES